MSDTRGEIRIGFVVNSGPMTSTGSKGATFIGHNSPRAEEVARYRSKPGTHPGYEGG